MKLIINIKPTATPERIERFENHLRKHLGDGNIPQHDFSDVIDYITKEVTQTYFEDSGDAEPLSIYGNKKFATSDKKKLARICSNCGKRLGLHTGRKDQCPNTEVK